MTEPVLAQPAPDFAELERVLRGEQRPKRVHLVELLMDEEVLQAISERLLGQPWRIYRYLEDTPSEPYFERLVAMYHRLGYDHVPLDLSWHHHPQPSMRKVVDTAALPRARRRWVDEDHGFISTWAEFERFPWDEIEADLRPCEFVARHLPQGMKMTPTLSLFEHVFHFLLGQERLYYMLYDAPELVAQVFSRWGQKVFDCYAAIIGMDEVGAIFHADDLGFNTSTLISPKALRQHVLPWLKKYAALAHENGKMFWYHCCGNVYGEVIEDLIEDVQIDAFHSFQDAILPVAEFKDRYGSRVAALGGVDIDKLAQEEEGSLRVYIRSILERCMPDGRFALGSGNSVANYIPLKNYFIMLEEARIWKP